MAKRLTDVGKWEDPWFMDLPNESRMIWIYLLDKCDHAGLWKVNRRLAEFQLNFKPDWDSFLTQCNGRIIIYSPERWFIPKFISFQYGVLTPECRPHRPVIEILEKFNLKGYLYPIDRDKEQEKEKDKEIKGGIRGDFEKFWGAYPKKRSKGQAEKAWAKIKPNEQLQDRILNALERAKTSADWQKDGGQFIPHPATWLNSKGWEDTQTVELQKQKPLKKPDKNCDICHETGKMDYQGVKVKCLCLK